MPPRILVIQSEPSPLILTSFTALPELRLSGRSRLNEVAVVLAPAATHCSPRVGQLLASAGYGVSSIQMISEALAPLMPVT